MNGPPATATGLPDRLRKTLADLASLTDRAERIEALISLSRKYRPPDPGVASAPYPESAKVPACESQAYAFVTERPAGGLDFHYAVENPQGISAMALAVLLTEALAGLPPSEVARVPRDVVYDIFGSELSMGKSMGLMGMVDKTRQLARQAAERTPGQRK